MTGSGTILALRARLRSVRAKIERTGDEILSPAESELLDVTDDLTSILDEFLAAVSEGLKRS